MPQNGMYNFGSAVGSADDGSVGSADDGSVGNADDASVQQIWLAEWVVC